jgi:hypothetical protein
MAMLSSCPEAGSGELLQRDAQVCEGVLTLALF